MRKVPMKLRMRENGLQKTSRMRTIRRRGTFFSGTVVKKKVIEDTKF